MLWGKCNRFEIKISVFLYYFCVMKLTYLSQPMLALNLDYNPSVRDTKEKQNLVLTLDLKYNSISWYADKWYRCLCWERNTSCKRNFVTKEDRRNWIEGTGVLSIDNENLILQIEYGSIY